jgi:hypothetical protein
MYTNELVDLLNKNYYSRRYFCGVLALDEVPLKKINHQCAFIVNTQKSSQPGQHWFGVFVPRHGPIEYFDSYGQPPRQQRIYDFISVNKRGFIYNNKRIQSHNSENCGQFTLFYIYFRCRGYTMKQYSKFFMPENFHYNDRFIEYLYKKHKH